ncbi:MAG: MBL fold metallo-hydrolase [Acidimicrobiia bacterium]|jgi:flavorubredoxin
METRTDEIADGIYRFSTFVPDAGIVFNQFLVDADEPLLFHTGMRGLFPLVSGALGAVIPVERLRWISFGHYEADECGAMNEWMAVAPDAQVAHTALGVMVSVADQAVRAPRPLADGEVIDLGGKRIRHLSTPHVPHGWDAGVMYEETTGTLFAGDLFTALGDGPATGTDDIVGPAFTAEDVFGATSLTPLAAPTIRRLADLAPATVALMHGPAYTGDGAAALADLADGYAARLAAAR